MESWESKGATPNATTPRNKALLDKGLWMFFKHHDPPISLNKALIFLGEWWHWGGIPILDQLGQSWKVSSL